MTGSTSGDCPPGGPFSLDRVAARHWVGGLPRGAAAAGASGLSGVTQLVQLEVRAGTPTGALPRVDRLLGAAIQLDVDPRIDFDVAAGLYRATREAGRPVRSLMDCLIAAVAVRTGAIVVTRTGTSTAWLRWPPI
jgi:predicted nucleic acid-binding protein